MFWEELLQVAQIVHGDDGGKAGSSHSDVIGDGDLALEHGGDQSDEETILDLRSV